MHIMIDLGIKSVLLRQQNEMQVKLSPYRFSMWETFWSPMFSHKILSQICTSSFSLNFRQLGNSHSLMAASLQVSTSNIFGFDSFHHIYNQSHCFESPSSLVMSPDERIRESMYNISLILFCLPLATLRFIF